MSAPNLKLCFPCKYERLSTHSYWVGIWLFGKKSGDPICVLNPAKEVFGTPPSTAGFTGTPGTTSATWFRPNACWTATETLRLKPSRKSFVSVGEKVWVQPNAALCEMRV